MADAFAPDEIDTGIPHGARVYDYLLGGRDNFPADREAAEKALEAFPTIRDETRQHRASMIRMVRALARHHGIRQFLDLGSGLPTAENVHEVVQRIQPHARVLYTDNDPIVLAHGRFLLEEDGLSRYGHYDCRDVDAVLGFAAEHFDLAEPVAVIAAATPHYLDDEDVTGLLDRYGAELVSGSAVAVSHLLLEGTPPRLVEMAKAALGVHHRSLEDIRRRVFPAGWPLVEPGLVEMDWWRPDVPPQDAQLRQVCGVAVKP
jgi:O-methyltransferase involved in polyketide biosynthesis